MHQKSLAIFSKNITIDSESSVIKNIVIVQEGLDKNNGYFTREFLDELTTQGNSQPNGVKSRFGHPNMCKTTLGTFIGRFKNFKSLEDEGVYKVIGDLHLDEITKKTNVDGQGISYFEYITEMANNNPDMFGNSIVFSCDMDYPEIEIEGETGIVERYLAPVSFLASDLVDSPAATSNLFKSSNDLGITLTQFLDENPEIFELVQKDDSLIQNFLNRYELYKNKKSNMNLIDKLLGKKQKDIEQTLGNGDVVTVVTDAQEAKVGDKVNDADGKPLADDTYILPDGSKWVIVGGEISEIIPMEETPEQLQLTPQEKQTILKMGEFMKSFDAKFDSFTKGVDEKFEGVAKVILDVQDKHSVLAKSVKSNYKSPEAVEKQITLKGEKSFMEKVLEQKEERKEN